jgi:hypothetical protein
MLQEQAVKSGTIESREDQQPGDEAMVSKQRWEMIRRLYWQERVSVSEIARRLELDRKTVRHWAGKAQWQPYSRAVRSDTLLAAHEQFVRERAAQVHYSARIVYQELKHKHGYEGSYETVKRAVAPSYVSWLLQPMCASRASRPSPGSRARSTGDRCAHG